MVFFSILYLSQIRSLATWQGGGWRWNVFDYPEWARFYGGVGVVGTLWLVGRQLWRFFIRRKSK